MNDFAEFYLRMETNEAAFCSIWADVVEINSHAQLFLNMRMPLDYFYNRLNLYEGAKPCEVLRKAECRFFKRAMNCYVYVHEKNTEIQHTLLLAGFSKIDKMDVMALEPQPDREDLARTAGLSIHRVGYLEIPIWVSLFRESFEIPGLQTEIQRTIELHFDKLILLISAVASDEWPLDPGGCCALLADQGILGLYCLGTVPKFRGIGLTRKMMAWGLQYAAINRLDCLFLQTFESQNLFAFYSKFGFRLAYKKRVYEKRYHEGSNHS